MRRLEVRMYTHARLVHGWVIMALYNKAIVTGYCPPRGEVINLGMVRHFGMVGHYD